jgi:hypothetical protein
VQHLATVPATKDRQVNGRESTDPVSGHCANGNRMVRRSLAGQGAKTLRAPRLAGVSGPDALAEGRIGV